MSTQRLSAVFVRVIGWLGLAFLTASSVVASQTLWVASDGDDTTGIGNELDPWATITHALDNAPDGSLILVKPGNYLGRVTLRGTFATGVTVRSEVPYQARLRHDATVVICFYGQGITL